MTPEERSILQQFLQDLAGARAQVKDPEADGLIADALRRNPDAAYLLVQHAVVADQALHAAQAQIADLQQRLAAQPAPQAPAPYPPQPSPWGQPQYPPPYQPQAYQPPPPYVPGAPAGYVGGGPFSGGGGGLGSFLRQAGTTAAGVAGGEVLFAGLSHLFGGGGGFGGGFGGQPRVEEVVNNYYDDGGAGGGSDSDGGWGDDGGSDGSDF